LCVLCDFVWGCKGTTFPAISLKKTIVSLAQPKKLYLCGGSYGGRCAADL